MTVFHERLSIHRTLYSIFKDEIFPLTISCSIGEIGAFVFVLVFVRISPERSYALKVCSIAGLVMGLVTVYSVVAAMGFTNQTNHEISVVLGYIGLVTDAILYGSPFATIRQILRSKSASTIPITMCSMGALCNLSWMVYATLEKDVFVFIPTSVSFAVGVSQVLLYLKFNPNKLTTKEDLEEAVMSASVTLTPKASEIVGVLSPSFEALLSPLAPLDRKPSAEQQVV